MSASSPSPAQHQLAALIDHTLVRPEATPSQIDQLCDQAAAWRFAAVCVNPIYVSQCARRLAATDVAVAALCAPLGACTTADKCDEARRAVEHGAREIELVL